jgi:hypothetical protein
LRPFIRNIRLLFFIGDGIRFEDVHEEIVWMLKSGIEIIYDEGERD